MAFYYDSLVTQANVNMTDTRGAILDYITESKPDYISAPLLVTKGFNRRTALAALKEFQRAGMLELINNDEHERSYLWILKERK